MRWSRLLPRLAFSIALLAALPLGCGTRARTQVMVEVHADAGLRARLTRVHLRAQGFDGTGLVPGMTFDRDVSAPLAFPISLAIVPQGEDVTRTFRFQATGFEGADEIVTVRARSGFRAGQTLRIVLVLEDACAGIRCTDLETCRAGVCSDAAIDPGTLLPLDSDAAIDASRLDAPMSAMDDAGLDAPMLEPDALLLDAPMTTDAGTDASSVPDAYTPPDATFDGGPCSDMPGRTFCPGEVGCFDLLEDDAHCGACDVFCLGGRTCNAGFCIYESTGADGAFRPMASMELAPGVHHFTVINIPPGVVITTSGSGVLDLRATGAITVQGSIDVSGGNGANGINPAALYTGSGGGGATGVPIHGTSATVGCATSGGGGAGAAGGNGDGYSDACDAPGAAFGGGAGAVWGGGGGGGGGHAGGGGGGGGTYGGTGGGGGATLGEVGGSGGMSVIVGSRAHGTAGAGGRAPGPYAGGDGSEATLCETGGSWAAGAGGGSIGRTAAEDPTVSGTLRAGSGGGGGGSHALGGSGSHGGAGGGGGGGAIRLSSPMAITIASTGRLVADGGDGGSVPTADEESGAGGGGSGGVVALHAPSVTIDGRISATGGAGGTNPCGGNGGAGGVGRVRLSVEPARCMVGGSATLDPPLPGGACMPSAPVDGRAYVGRWPD